MTSYADAINELSQNTSELKTLLCNVAANQKKLKYACSQFETFNRKFKETHSEDGTFDRNEMMSFKVIIEQISRLKSIVAHNFSQQWAQNTINSSSSSLASDICSIIKKCREEAEKIDPENASIFDPSNPNWLKYHILDLRTIATSFNNFLNKRATEDQVSTAIKERLKSINKFINEYKNEDITPEGCVFSVIPIHYKSWRLEQTDFEKKELIGSGASARVYKGFMKESGQEVAIKQLKPKELKGGKFRSFQREISILAMVDHPTVLKFYGATDTFPYSIVTEWMGGGDLYKALKTRSLSNTQLTICAFDIARGMAYLHENMIVHRDLKSLNILLDKDGYARICDLGFARVVEQTTHDSIKTFVGTYYWMAPELLEDRPSYSPKVDVYSYGIMLWEMLTKKIPYNGEDPTKVIKKVFINNSRPKMPLDIDKVPGMQNLIEACWERDPKLRPTFKEVVNCFASGEAYYPDTDVDQVVAYARKVLAEEDPDSLKVKTLLEENEKSPITLEKFNEVFESIHIPTWYFDPVWKLFQSFVPSNFSNANCNFEALAKGLFAFINTTNNFNAIQLLTKFPNNTIPSNIVDKLIDSMPTIDDKIDEFICIIACNNSKAADAILRVFPTVPSQVTFKYLSNNVDKIEQQYIDPIIGRIFLSLTSMDDAANEALECFVSMATYFNKLNIDSKSESENKNYQMNISKILSDDSCKVVFKFAKNISDSITVSHKQTSSQKTSLYQVSNYIIQMIIANIPFNKNTCIFDVLLNYPANSEMMKANLPKSLENNQQSAINFLQWLSVPENMKNLSFDTFTSLVSVLKPHKAIYKDVKNVIALAKNVYKNKSKDYKKVDQIFN